MSEILERKKNEIKTDSLENSFSSMIKAIGENTSRQGLQGTPKRAAKAFRFLTKGYQENVHEVINGALYESAMNQMILVKDIELYSLCEHHLLPFVGRCHVAYLPNGKVLGLSKIARIVEMYARRLQIQENLTQQIGECLSHITQAKGVGVIIEAQHMCMMMRGIEKQNSRMTTSFMLGLFRDNPRTRSEFLDLIGMHSGGFNL